MKVTILLVFVVLILLAMVRDGVRDGMLETKNDWLEFGLFVASLIAIGAGAWWLSGVLWVTQQTAGAIVLFIAGVMMIQATLSIVSRVAHNRSLARLGVFTAQQWCQRVDAALTTIKR